MKYTYPFFRYFFLWALLPLACREQEGLPLKLSMYHWKTQLELSPWEEAYLDSLEVGDLYLRMMDIDWDPYRKQAVFVSPLQIKRPPPASLNLVPTVFITLRTLKNLPADSIPSLARDIQKSIKHLLAPFPNQLSEIQLDHDWTSQTREAFFSLLKEVRKIYPEEVLVSSTLRLHQYKYPLKTGIPPADRFMLMVYNMGRVTDPETPNSILDLDTSREYLLNTPPYPVSCDLALPIFSWAAIFRDGLLVRLLPISHSPAEVDQFPWKKEKKDQWEVLRGHYYAGYYLYAGDQIRLEYVSSQALKEVAILLASKKNQAWERLAFFHLDETQGKKYPSRDLLDIQNILSP